MKNMTSDQLDAARSQGEMYGSECFREVWGGCHRYLECAWRGDFSQPAISRGTAFVVGPVDLSGWNAEVRFNGAVVARNERNTGWAWHCEELAEA